MADVGEYALNAAPAGAGGMAQGTVARPKKTLAGEPGAKAASITLVVCGFTVIAAFIAALVLGVVNAPTIINTAYSSAYNAYQPYNLTETFGINCSAQSTMIRSIPIAWTGLLVVGSVMVVLGFTWYKAGHESSFFGHVRARWFYAFAGITLATWFTQIMIGVVQIMEWVLVIGLCVGIVSVEWALCECKWLGYKFVKENKRRGLIEGYALKHLYWLEVFFLLFILADLGVALGYNVINEGSTLVAPWVYATFAIEVFFLIMYVLWNGIYHIASPKFFDHVSWSELITSIIIACLVVGVFIAGVAGQYIGLHP